VGSPNRQSCNSWHADYVGTKARNWTPVGHTAQKLAKHQHIYGCGMANGVREDIEYPAGC
jgi:hypothetical protein